MADNNIDASDENSPLVLDGASSDAWQAYNHMFDTKQQHYEFLEMLENKKKKFNISPSQSDQQKLAEFLSEHDRQVRRFTQLAQQLKMANPESHLNLFKFIAQLGDGEPNQKTPR